MAIIENINGKLTVYNRPARWCQWTLVVADVDEKTSPAGEGVRLPGALGGLPGGYEVRDEKELFEKFDVRVKGESHIRTPGGGQAKLAVQLRAERADDFTGPGLKAKQANPDLGETNDLHTASKLVGELLSAFQKDAVAPVGDLQKKAQREKLAAALRALADAL